MKQYARTWFQQFKGLMFDDTPDVEMEFEFKQPTRLGASVHTFFMKYPIQVQWLNENREVLEEAKLNPWVLIYFPKKAAKFIVEKRCSN